MQKLQPQIQAVREKYKDNPQKLNQATMEIFKENKVNPVGGCLHIPDHHPAFRRLLRHAAKCLRTALRLVPVGG